MIESIYAPDSLTIDVWPDNLLNDQQLELFFSTVTPSPKNAILENEDKQSLLGQVFTPATLAKFMVSLIRNDLQTNHKVLDPCIGPNTFFKNIDAIPETITLTGIELDETLIDETTKSFYSKSNRNLVIGSFFNLHLSEKYDFIIQNPPYVRQELMMNGENSKSTALRSLSPLAEIIPSKSNLYVYFLLKSIFHLNDKGRLVAVIYDSWLYSDFGKFLKEAFTRFGSIEAIYHFRRNAFPDAEVGATVIDFKRILNSKEKNRLIKIYSLKTPNDIASYGIKLKLPYKQLTIQEFFEYRFNEETVIDFKTGFFKPINKIANQPIQRGISSIANKYFIHEEQLFDESIPFVKDVTSIETFEIKSELSYLLALNGSITEKTRKYLDNAKAEIITEPEKFRALKKQIEQSESWFKVQLKKPGNVLFNYYMRKNIDFILNESLYYSSDNFYIVNIESNLLANLAILNSSFTRIALLLHSRNQGSGLRKIQLYEFKEVPVIDVNKLSNESIVQLEAVAMKLKSTSRFSESKEKVINEIDEILIKEYNLHNNVQLTTNQLYQDIQNIFSVNQDATALV
jgi:hypothetical protein